MGKELKEERFTYKRYSSVQTKLAEINDEVAPTLSKDQKLFYEYIIAISKGEVSAGLYTQKVGPLNHGR